jgi:Cytochrome P460
VKFAGALVVAALACGWSVSAQQPANGPAYSPSGELLRPQNYREWVFLTSGLGMTYGPAAEGQSARAPLFDNVFVNRSSYEAFVKEGRWPDKTMFILEGRRSLENVSINNGGRTQGDRAFIEAAVKDVQRFKETGGWAYFSFDSPSGLVNSVKPLPTTAPCYACHANNTAVENTFVQFYPELFEIAKQKGTVKTTYDPNKKP